MDGAPGQGLPVLALPGMVVLPGERASLHVADPRYQALVSWCLSGDHELVVAGVLPRYALPVSPRYPGIAAALEAASNLSDIHAGLFAGATIARIAQHQYLPDGRVDVVLEHVWTARIHREHVTPEPFRRVTCKPVVREALDAPGRVAALRGLALQVSAGVGPALAPADFASLRDDELVDTLAARFLSHPDHRRAYLMARNPLTRIEIVERGVVSVVEHLSPSLDA